MKDKKFTPEEITESRDFEGAHLSRRLGIPDTVEIVEV